MRKICFFLSASIHLICIALLTQISFPIKIALTSPTIIEISLRKLETVSQAPLFIPDFQDLGNHEQMPALLSGSGSDSGTSSSSRSSPLDRLPAIGMQPNSSLFTPGGRLKLKSAPSSSFSLALPVPGPLIASAITAISKTGKWLKPGEYTAGTYPGGIQFNDTGSSAGIHLSPMPFTTQDKETALWTQSVMARIERNWIIPTMARVGLVTQVEITLTIDHGGNRLSLIVAKSSSQEALDQAVLNAMKASLPFPPLPENISAQTFVFNFVFTYNA